MKGRLARFCVVLLPVMALVAGNAPPAHSLMASAVVFTGTADVGNGIAYPCLQGKDPVPTPPTNLTIDPAKCVADVSLSQSASFTFVGNGAGVTAKLNKAKCKNAPVNDCIQIATYSITAAGTVNGTCGLSAGTGAGSITKTADLVTQPPITKPPANNPPIAFTFSWTGIGGLLVMTGAATRGTDSGILVSAVVAQQSTGGLLTTGTCANKAPKTFVIAGGAAVVWPNVP